MKQLTELFVGTLRVASAKLIETEFGNIVELGLDNMTHKHVLSITIQIPEEVVSEYDLPDFPGYGCSIYDPLTEHLKSKSRRNKDKE